MNVEIRSFSFDGLTDKQKEELMAAAYNVLWSQPMYTKSPERILEILDGIAERNGTDRHTEVVLYIIRLQECKQCKPRPKT